MEKKFIGVYLTPEQVDKLEQNKLALSKKLGVRITTQDYLVKMIDKENKRISRSK